MHVLDFFYAFSLLPSLWVEFFISLRPRASLVAQMVKNLPAIWEMQVQSWVRMIPWRRAWQPTPVLLPGEFHEQRSLVGYSPGGHKESDTTERLSLSGRRWESSDRKLVKSLKFLLECKGLAYINLVRQQRNSLPFQLTSRELHSCSEKLGCLGTD